MQPSRTKICQVSMTSGLRRFRPRPVAGSANTSCGYNAADELTSRNGSATGIDVKTFWGIPYDASASLQSCG